jgi:tetratricopeptide (TPR) repeat protein
VGRKGDEALSLARWHEALEDPEIQEELAEIDYGEVESILSTLLLGPTDLAAYLGEAELLTDDRPFLEFVAPRAMQGSHMVANIEALAEHCQSPLEGMEAPELAQIRDGRVARALARSTAFEVSGQLVESQGVLAEVWPQGAGIARLAVRYQEATWRLAAALVQAGRGEEAVRVYRRHLSVDPAFEGGWLNLGLLLAQQGEPGPAREALEKVRDPELSPSAAQALSMLRALEPGHAEEDGE